MTMRQLKREIREQYPQWAFLTYILGQHREPRLSMGVNARGIVMLNPFYARQVGLDRVVEVIRAELSLQDELAYKAKFLPR